VQPARAAFSMNEGNPMAERIDLQQEPNVKAVAPAQLNQAI